MCWSGPASAGMASLGFGGAIFARWRNEGWMRWGTLAYFSTMELLQAFTYSVIGVYRNFIENILNFIKI